MVLTLGMTVGTAGCGGLPSFGKEKASPDSTASSDKGGTAGSDVRKTKPARLKIASASVNAGPFMELAAKPNLNEAIADKHAGSPGWFTDSAAPGEKGVSVFITRYGAAGGPGLMKNVAKVRVGDPVQVDRVDGSTVSFKIREVQQVIGNKLPPEKKGDKPKSQAELRVITVGVPLEKSAADTTKDKDGEGKKDDSKSPDKPSYSNIIFYADLAK
ncbi:class F sortase [Streptomyces sp. ISL-44]|uniref:sortase domain-containing protein n=1 Tax=Streptomyces sp. ISL-44 TaxID=2819184 RepID=UPI001BEC9AC7|nr:class F sortase [Streptomyces sp. ISL-44]MBT2546366.1 class F sortase [Streptomyces sp. ISL-44]